MTACDGRTAVVAVRIPRETDADLATAASRRLAATVEDIEIAALHGVDPGLAATIVTVEVCVPGGGSVAALTEAPGVEDVRPNRSDGL